MAESPGLPAANAAKPEALEGTATPRQSVTTMWLYAACARNKTAAKSVDVAAVKDGVVEYKPY